MTTETSLTTAGSDGKLNLTSHVQPARVKRADGWHPVDAGLEHNADGTWSPKVTPSAVTLSGGGDGPLAELTDRTGRGLALTFPVTLPKPAVTGNGARYADVLPGVDLQVTVSDQGAVREVLVVRDAKAAANPALSTLRLGTSTKGATVSSDGHGNITVTGSDGKAAFVAPAPVMWDSTSAPAAPPKTALGAAAETAGAAEAPSSSADGPGRNAKVRPIAVKADPKALTLTPDADLLAGRGTVWPLYIDPTFTPTPPMGTSHYAQVMEGCPNAPQYDKPQANGQGAGYQQYQSNCYGMERSYYEFDTSALNNQMIIDSATAYFTETYAARDSCDPKATAPVTLKWMRDGISGGTDWNHQPAVYQDLNTQWPRGAKGPCGWQSVNFPVADAIRSVAEGGIRAWTVGLFGDESYSSNNINFMRFNTNPYVTAVYTIRPNTPDALYTAPDSQNPSGCNSWGNAGWIGLTTLAGDASNITLNAYASTSMPGANLNVNFSVWDSMVDDGHGDPASATSPSSPQFGSAGWGRANIGGRVRDGHQYGWNATASDGGLAGGTSGACYFNVDLTPPSAAAFTPSTAFPPLGSGLTPTAHAGDPNITVRVTSTDPLPTGCTRGACIRSGVRAFQYALDDNIPPVGGNTVSVSSDANGTAAADIPIALNRDNWGAHTLFVRAVDGAGNTQPQASRYDFYAPWNPANKVQAGDLDGDGTPDFLAPASDGSLSLVPGNSDVTAPPGLASAQSQSPEKDSWNNYLVAHRGSASGQSVDDLFAYDKASKKLYVYFNDATATPPGTPGHFSLGRVSQIGTSSSCAMGIDGTWNNITQLVSPGSGGNPAGRANLITVEKGALRFYPGSAQSGCQLGAGATLGEGDWSTVTLIAPGAVGGVPTLWARDAVTGALLTYTLPLGADGTPNGVLHAPVHRPLVSAVKDASGAAMCADIEGGHTANGTPALLWNCATGSPNQQFTLGADGTLRVLGKCLDVLNGATYNGANVTLWDCHDAPDQKWEPGSIAGTLRNPASGRCLADPNGSNTPGAHLILWDCLDDSSQKWDGAPADQRLTAQLTLPVSFGTADYPTVDSPGDVNGDGNPDLFVLDASGRLAEVPGAAPVNGVARFAAPVQLGVPNKR